MICEATGPFNAIGKIAAAQVRAALAAGYRVSVVANRLDEALQDEVEWLPLYCPPRGFALKWLSARYLIRRAMRGRSFDVIHGHQPQVADLCDIFQCHFLTRVASERGCLVSGSGPGAALRRWQQEAIVFAEDWHYRRVPASTRMLFVSELIQREFARLYGLPASHEVFENAPPPWNPIEPSERERARQWFGIDQQRRPVVGFFGGLQHRKGYQQILDAVAADDELFLLIGGQQTEGFVDERLRGRMLGIGLTGEPDRFFAACDVLVVPSWFDPCPMVVLEAAARGLPVIATEGVGNRQTLLAHGAGLGWDGQQSLTSLVGEIMAHREEYVAGCRSLAQNRSQQQNMQRLLERYERVLESQPNRSASAPHESVQSSPSMEKSAS
jgi:glycosyltransferase involved in cell wall biosynthesis